VRFIAYTGACDMSLSLTKAVILAGGSSRRMGGGDKPLLALANRPILDWIVDRLKPQVEGLAISANGDPNRLHAYGLEILSDHTPNLGPMSGILAALNWARQTAPETTHVLTVSGDTPFLPSDLVARLYNAIRDDNSSMATAASGGELHATVSLWPISASTAISESLGSGEGKRVNYWLQTLNTKAVEWPNSPIDPFFNINTPNDFLEAERLAKFFPNPNPITFG